MTTTPQHLPGQTLTHPGRTADMTPVPDHGEETYVGSGRLQGRRAVVTGGDSGIGRAVALAYAREGADVLVVHLPAEQEDADATVALVEAAGRKGISVAGDLTDEGFCRQVVERAVTELGGLDVLVNNAAYQMTVDSLTDLSTDQLVRTFSTNVFAAVWLTQSALPHLQPGSSVITTVSVQADSPSPGLVDYAMTKAALVNLTQNLAQELGPRGIRVNAVAPGPIWTPLIPATMPAEQVEDFGAQTPLGRAGQPAEVAPAYVHLASAESSYTSGAVLRVGGGK
jgi:NAD(P)-dependent dehydrogenase (short-subunit alcohol dehydrogenase family)